MYIYHIGIYWLRVDDTVHKCHDDDNNDDDEKNERIEMSFAQRKGIP